MAETVVLLHAMGCSNRMWRAQTEALRARYDVVAPDLPGHGDSPGRFTITAAAERLRETLREKVGPVHLIGASLGATVALRFALTQPDRIASLLLSGATLRVPRLAVAAQRVITAILPLSLTSTLSAKIARPADATDSYTFVADIRRAGKQSQFDALRELGRFDPRPALNTINAPTLVCVGDRDQANMPSAHLLAEQIPGATLRIVPDGGHMWNLQHPELCTEIISDFVNRAK